MVTAANLARAVIFDPYAQNLRTTRYGLYEAGFRHIEAYSDLSEFRDRIAAGTAELLIADAMDSDETLDLVQAVRRGDLAGNPFMVILLTSWRCDAGAVHAALQTGADDVMLRPFSARFMATRIRGAVERRRQFVATADYLGPDRDADFMAPDAGVRPFDAPNTLRSAVQGDQEALTDALARVELLKAPVRRERAVRLAAHIGREAMAAAQGRRDAGGIAELAGELRDIVTPLDAEAGRLAAAIVRALGGEDRARGLKLTQELALGVEMLCERSGAGDEGGFAAEVERLLAAPGAAVARAA